MMINTTIALTSLPFPSLLSTPLYFNPTNNPSQSVTCLNQAYAEASFFSEFFFSKYSFDFASLLASRR